MYITKTVGTDTSAKTHAGKNLAWLAYVASDERTREEMQGKSSVTSIACVARHYSRENTAWLTFAAAAILRSV